MTQPLKRRSFRSNESTLTAVEALVKDWPEISPEKARRVAALLRSSTLGVAA